ncbi:3' terminal RNA ribose 2'-O-methyltransferase Hen1 [Nocardia sp. NPDC051463]|uniref:3' terminal RNA ribose 2'-O-methyltransferase Hen1 n=1 Tax=Nocardia sp. NPDC051463 TaxID=3154845 RepID=UPI00344C8E28
MLLTITCAAPEDAEWPATDLGFLLHKNPDRVQAFEQSYGVAHVLYPQADAARCTAALVLEVDPIRLVRGRSRSTPDFSLGQYVNDRPYAASSLLSVALGAVFRTALHGRCDQRPELVRTALPLRIELPAVPCKGGPEAAERVFGPLGWTVAVTPLPLDPAFPEWGDSHYVRIELTGTLRLADALSHLYVLLPVLDGAKHYWVAADEVDKLIRASSGWLAEHPDRAWITRRYLARRHSLVRTALARLAEIDDTDPEQLDAVEDTGDEFGKDTGTISPAAERTVEAGEHTPSLATLRREAVLAALREVGARRVLDLGCGDGVLLRELLADSMFSEVVGVDVSMRSLNIAKRRLRLDRLPERVAQRLTLRQGALTYTDARLRGYDAAVLMEVVEHVDPPRLGALEHAVFSSAAPTSVIVTTPNAEYNALYEGLAAGTFRHSDHRFEWTRAEFAAWADRVAARHGYRIRFVPVGPEHPDAGSSSQLAVFTKATAETTDGTKGVAQ